MKLVSYTEQDKPDSISEEYIAIFLRELDSLHIYKIEKNEIETEVNGRKPHPMTKTFDKIAKQDFYKHFKGGEGDLKWVKDIQFDRTSKLLLLKGDKKIQIMDFREEF